MLINEDSFIRNIKLNLCFLHLKTHVVHCLFMWPESAYEKEYTSLYIQFLIHTDYTSAHVTLKLNIIV